MSSICIAFGLLVPRWRQRKARVFVVVHSRNNFLSASPVVCCSNHNNPIPKPNQLSYDPSEDILGLEVYKPRNVISSSQKPRSWFGPNGQYIKELPCPTCRGRGYTPCIESECGIERARPDCSQCSGKGIITCHQCSGDCVIWQESIDEQPWEKARSISPLKVDDDEVDKLDVELDVKKKSKRVYQSPPPEVGLKISRSLKSLNAKTGLFSKRMKMIHSDPKLHAQRVAAMKRAKRTPSARKQVSEAMKAYFSDPENRHKRSIAMKGVKFFCGHCGREGHRKHYCLENDRSYNHLRCGSCGEKGHNRRTCPKILFRNNKHKVHRCRVCKKTGHNSRTCPRSGPSEKQRKKLTCRVCQQQGHNSRTCPVGGSNKKQQQVCPLCQQGHNSKSCPKSRETSPPKVINFEKMFSYEKRGENK